MDKDRQQQLSMQKVEKYISAELSTFVVDNLGEDPPIDELFEFTWLNNRELLMELNISIFKPRDVDVKKEWLDALQRGNLMGYLYVCLKYIAMEQGLRKLIVIVDNCDQKDPILMESFVSAVGHLDNCFENVKGDYDFVPRLVSIVACRPIV